MMSIGTHEQEQLDSQVFGLFMEIKYQILMIAKTSVCSSCSRQVSTENGQIFSVLT